MSRNTSRTAAPGRPRWPPLLCARHRLCLTGTPLQNHLGERWPQFHFLLPGLLGDEKQCNSAFRKSVGATAAPGQRLPDAPHQALSPAPHQGPCGRETPR
ncbi:SNF2-related protein [Massilia pseudoviolaceinigra]|uniref:SNF2-related protein n=1 Tax=Massilia pseudoviolaceinigra TaxID=3057165 RepID=UPI00279687C0|nr:SNF2-related protein [Massilia sp. CCM 9206]MDQ1924352.1 SNF2-related protein [Massilia sp. CCM 9206]